MAIKNAYSLYDRKALVYSAPFYALADGEAIRFLVDALRDPNVSFARHPDDYVLYRVGGFDDLSGSLLPVSAIEHITDVAALVRDRRGPDEQLDLYADLTEATAQTVSRLRGQPVEVKIEKPVGKS